MEEKIVGEKKGSSLFSFISFTLLSIASLSSRLHSHCACARPTTPLWFTDILPVLVDISTKTKTKTKTKRQRQREKDKETKTKRQRQRDKYRQRRRDKDKVDKETRTKRQRPSQIICLEFFICVFFTVFFNLTLPQLPSPLCSHFFFLFMYGSLQLY
jgi:hypothetical protein